MAQCDFCFRDKSPLSPPLPKIRVQVCKACDYQIQRVVGFLRHSGADFIVRVDPGDVSESAPGNPPTPLKSKKKGAKEEEGI